MAQDAQERRGVVWKVAFGLTLAAGTAIGAAVVHWSGFCESGISVHCLNGTPSFALIAPVLWGAASLLTAVVAVLLAGRGSNRLAAASMVLTVLFLATGVLFIDAATHGWDNLKLLWLG